MLRSLRFTLVLGLATLIVLCVPPPARSMDKAKFKAELIELDSLLADSSDAIYKQAKQKREQKISFDFRGDDSRAKSQYELKVGAEIVQNLYPGEFRFTMKSDVRYKDSKIDEDLTHLLVNYDYAFLRYLEAYVFAGRISDNFLSIDQRYEVGFGFKFHGYGAFRTDYVEKLDGLVWKDSESARQVRNETLGLIYKDARFGGGLAFSFFAELEQAKITPSFTHLDTCYTKQDTAFSSVVKSVTEEREFSVGSDHAYRFVVRPSIFWRPTPALYIRSLVYLKFRFDEMIFTRHSDLRVDSQITSTFKLNDSVSVTLGLEQRFDTDPPVVADSDIQAVLDTLPRDTKVKGARAQDRHSMVTMGIVVKL